MAKRADVEILTKKCGHSRSRHFKILLKKEIKKIQVKSQNKTIATEIDEVLDQRKDSKDWEAYKEVIK